MNTALLKSERFSTSGDAGEVRDAVTGAVAASRRDRVVLGRLLVR
jgi:hypothetical protein